MEEEGKSYAGMTRRSFAIGCTGAAALLAVGGLKAVPAAAQVRPPGGQDEDHVISACVRCERCIEVCPRGALRAGHLEDGILGVRLPTAGFDAGWCDFCTEENGGVPLCVQACPTGALRLDEGATAQSTILGKAVLRQDWCLAWARLNGCRFCYDACPYDAIVLDGNKRPSVVADKCNGCGACQASCVSLKEGSIVEGATARAIRVVPLDQAEA
ncbi:4Fe-4S dicluster domain-containing protein [uncultured Senegalimassilia sp.]|uniref:4Fe-4S dicluster domain-containing protein n=1 Tax=uncultured Senegalimassilia sp. TaxID=1714350 RepID=UPI0027DBA1A7|nr:4Fe-4S dicluster domain-containing protein [uncultured Senegalimassilia sp.]